MKDTKILVIANCLLVIGLLWTLGVAQVSAVNYQTKYKGSMYNVQSPISYGAAAPAATFQSTSTYASPEWAEQPMLNSDGTVNEGAYMGGRNYAPGRPRRVDANNDGYDDDTGLPVNPIVDEEDDEGNVPLGDALIPLMLCMCAYAIYKVSRRRKEA